MSRKLKIAVLFGGRSPEHGVSLQSAAAVLRHMDRERYEPVRAAWCSTRSTPSPASPPTAAIPI